MKNSKNMMISGAALVLVLALAGAAGAQQGRGPRAGIRANIGQLVGVPQIFRGLQLTETQRQEIRALVQARKADILNARKALLQARLALLKEDPNGSGEFGAAQAKMMALRQDLLNQIKTKLTADQLDILQKRQQRRADALEERLKRLDSGK